MSVERGDKDKDADENVDTDQISTVRPVSGQSTTGLFTQREEIYIDFRIPGLSHAVVKEAEHFRVQELDKKDRKSSLSRSTSGRLAAEQRLQPTQH